MARKSFNEKMHTKTAAEYIILYKPEHIKKYNGTKMVVAPAPDYDALMKRVSSGQLVTSVELREHLAKKYNANSTCPLTAGIFINLCAHASVERNGKDITPYWRTLRTNGELNQKYPGGIENQKQLLENEGHVVIQKGKRFFVENYQQKLFKL